MAVGGHIIFLRGKINFLIPTCFPTRYTSMKFTCITYSIISQVKKVHGRRSSRATNPSMFLEFPA